MDFSPAVMRAEGLNEMLKKSRLVLLHDSEELRYYLRAEDLNVKRKFSSWNGHKAMTDCDDVFYNITIDPSSKMKISDTRQICTSIIKGDKDSGDLFEKMVELFDDHYDDINSCYHYYNYNSKDFCSHLRLLIPSTILVSGDILEMGSGDKDIHNLGFNQTLHVSGICSTELMHNITVSKLEEGGRGCLYTLDSDEEWLNKFHNLQSDHHKIWLINEGWDADRVWMRLRH